jgi:hypothetical protein
MDITCIETGSSTICQYPYIEQIDIGSGEYIYINELWTSFDILSFFFIVVLVVFIITAGIFRFFYSPVHKRG